MPRKPDLTIIGQTFNNLIVNKLTDEYNSYNRRLYECTCLLCGEKRLATKSNLVRGEIKDCGKHKPYNDITGKQYGKLTVMYVTDKKRRANDKTKMWHCKCKCGGECDVSYADLSSGIVQSCGCLRRENLKKLCVDGTMPCKLNNKIRSTNTSGVTGVWYDKRSGNWCAEIMFKRKKYSLGRYSKKEEAIAVRKMAEEKIFGEFLEWYKASKSKN